MRAPTKVAVLYIKYYYVGHIALCKSGRAKLAPTIVIVNLRNAERVVEGADPYNSW